MKLFVVLQQFKIQHITNLYSFKKFKLALLEKENHKKKISPKPTRNNNNKKKTAGKGLREFHGMMDSLQRCFLPITVCRSLFLYGD